MLAFLKKSPASMLSFLKKKERKKTAPRTQLKGTNKALEPREQTLPPLTREESIQSFLGVVAHVILCLFLMGLLWLAHMGGK